MKKIVLLFVLVGSLIGLFGCTESNEVILPSISGLSYTDAKDILRAESISFYQSEEETLDLDLIGLVKGYKVEEAGDVYSGDPVTVIVYVKSESLFVYFEPLELEYDGPYLSDSYQDIDYTSPRGGYFNVELVRCTDGDTAKFSYPDDIYEVITNYAKSVRFLSIDTEETYTGGEEEWGKPASVYTCSLLTTAESIIIQTDPSYSLTDTYGRLLGWVWAKFPGETEYFLVNYMIVKQGLAQIKYETTSNEQLMYDNLTYSEWMHQALDYAVMNEIAQWGDDLDYYWDYENSEPKDELWE